MRLRKTDKARNDYKKCPQKVSEAMKLVLNEDKNEIETANLHHYMLFWVQFFKINGPLILAVLKI
jgi:hypothetical protein